MRGLRMQETEEFEKFFQIVQNKAAAENKIFFVFAGEGNDFKTEGLECEDLSGWLIPIEDAEEFESVWKKTRNFEDTAKWNKMFTWAFWHEVDGEITIEFKQFLTEM